MNFQYTFLICILINQIHSYYYEKCTQNNKIVLTFDDSPNPNTTHLLLKILNKYNIDATFFINGYYVEKYNLAKLIKKMAKTQTIASHTFSHASLSKLNKFNIQREFYDNEYIFRKILNKRPLFFRPPYFDYDENIVEIVKDFNYTIIGSNMNIQDWQINNASEMFNIYTEKIHKNNSYIILMHDYVEENVDLLEKLIKYVKKIGYSIVSLKDCLNFQENYNEDNLYSPNLISGFDF